MARTCTVCRHEQRAEIDRLLLTGTPIRDVAGRFDLSPSSVDRHRVHIPEALAKAREAEEIGDADDLLAQLRGLQERTLAILERPEDQRTALGAIAQARGNLALMADLVERLVTVEQGFANLELLGLLLDVLEEHLPAHHRTQVLSALLTRARLRRLVPHLVEDVLADRVVGVEEATSPKTREEDARAVRAFIYARPTGRLPAAVEGTA